MGAGHVSGRRFNRDTGLVVNNPQQINSGHVDGHLSDPPHRFGHVGVQQYHNPFGPFVGATIDAVVHLPQRIPNLTALNATKSFAAAVTGSMLLPHLRPNNTFIAYPSLYPNLALGQLAGDVTNGGFVRNHAMEAGEFGLVPSLPITPQRSTINGKPVLELSDNDVALAEDVFRFAFVI